MKERILAHDHARFGPEKERLTWSGLLRICASLEEPQAIAKASTMICQTASARG